MQPQRKITPTGTGNMLGVGMGGTNGLKALNSGWQVRTTRKPPTRFNLIWLLGLGIRLAVIETETD